MWVLLLAGADSWAQSKPKGALPRKPNKTLARKTKAMSAYRGSQNTLSRSNQNAGRRENMSAKSLQTSSYRGNISNRGNRQRMKRTSSYGHKSLSSSGSISQSRLNRRYRELRANDRKAQAYRGSQRINERSNRSAGLLANRGGGSLETSSYRGNISARSIRKSQKAIKANNRKSSSYRGSISNRDVRRSNKKIAANNRRLSTYRGSISLKSIRSRDRRIEKNNKKMRNYRGDMRIAKRPKGAYPGGNYRGGDVNNAYQKKAKYRSRMLKRVNKNRKLQQPNYQRKKDEKPTYDSRESEIWSKPGHPGTIKKK